MRRWLALPLITLAPWVALAQPAKPKVAARSIDFQGYTVSQLASLTPGANEVVEITDGASKSDCTVGSGTNRVLCVWSGTAWSPVSGQAPAGTASQLQIHNPTGAFGSDADLTYDFDTDTLKTKKHNNVLYARYYSTGAGTAGDPYLGWSSAITGSTNATVVFEAGKYQSSASAGYNIPDGVHIVCEPGAEILFPATRTKDVFMFSASNTSDNWSVEGCTFGHNTAWDHETRQFHTDGGGGWIKISTKPTATPVSNIDIIDNVFGYGKIGENGLCNVAQTSCDEDADCISPEVCVGQSDWAHIYLDGAVSNLEIRRNMFKDAPYSLRCWAGDDTDPSVTFDDVQIVNNTWNYDYPFYQYVPTPGTTQNWWGSITCGRSESGEFPYTNINLARNWIVTGNSVTGNAWGRGFEWMVDIENLLITNNTFKPVSYGDYAVTISPQNAAGTAEGEGVIVADNVMWSDDDFPLDLSVQGCSNVSISRNVGRMGTASGHYCFRLGGRNGVMEGNVCTVPANSDGGGIQIGTGSPFSTGNFQVIGNSVSWEGNGITSAPFLVQTLVSDVVFRGNKVYLPNASYLPAYAISQPSGTCTRCSASGNRITSPHDVSTAWVSTATYLQENNTVLDSVGESDTSWTGTGMYSFGGPLKFSNDILMTKTATGTVDNTYTLSHPPDAPATDGLGLVYVARSGTLEWSAPVKNDMFSWVLTPPTTTADGIKECVGGANSGIACVTTDPDCPGGTCTSKWTAANIPDAVDGNHASYATFYMFNDIGADTPGFGVYDWTDGGTNPTDPRVVVRWSLYTGTSGQCDDVTMSIKYTTNDWTDSTTLYTCTNCGVIAQTESTAALSGTIDESQFGIRYEIDEPTGPLQYCQIRVYEHKLTTSTLDLVAERDSIRFPTTDGCSSIRYVGDRAYDDIDCDKVRDSNESFLAVDDQRNATFFSGATPNTRVDSAEADCSGTSCPIVIPAYEVTGQIDIPQRDADTVIIDHRNDGWFDWTGYWANLGDGSTPRRKGMGMAFFQDGSTSSVRSVSDGLSIYWRHLTGGNYNNSLLKDQMSAVKINAYSSGAAEDQALKVFMSKQGRGDGYAIFADAHCNAANSFAGDEGCGAVRFTRLGEYLTATGAVESYNAGTMQIKTQSYTARTGQDRWMLRTNNFRRDDTGETGASGTVKYGTSATGCSGDCGATVKAYWNGGSTIKCDQTDGGTCDWANDLGSTHSPSKYCFVFESDINDGTCDNFPEIMGRCSGAGSATLCDEDADCGAYTPCNNEDLCDNTAWTKPVQLAFPITGVSDATTLTIDTVAQGSSKGYWGYNVGGTANRAAYRIWNCSQIASVLDVDGAASESGDRAYTLTGFANWATDDTWEIPPQYNTFGSIAHWGSYQTTPTPTGISAPLLFFNNEVGAGATRSPYLIRATGWFGRGLTLDGKYDTNAIGVYDAQFGIDFMNYNLSGDTPFNGFGWGKGSYITWFYKSTEPADRRVYLVGYNDEPTLALGYTYAGGGSYDRYFMQYGQYSVGAKVTGNAWYQPMYAAVGDCGNGCVDGVYLNYPSDTATNWATKYPLKVSQNTVNVLAMALNAGISGGSRRLLLNSSMTLEGFPAHDNTYANGTYILKSADGTVATTGEVQLGSLTAASATCLSDDTDRLYADTDCSNTKDSTESYINEQVTTFNLPLVHCNNGTATPLWNLAADADSPDPACVSGTNVVLGVLDFVDSATNGIQTSVTLPFDWVLANDIIVRLKGITTATSGSAVYKVSAACAADNETYDPSFGTELNISVAAKGSANLIDDGNGTLADTSHLTACAAGELMYLRIRRDPTFVTDNLNATSRLVSVELTWRRQI